MTSMSLWIVCLTLIQKIKSMDRNTGELETISRQLLEIADKKHNWIKTGKRVKYLQKRITEEGERERELAVILNKEKSDYLKMGKISLKHLFHIFLHNAERQKEKEKQEYLSALLKWEQCSNEIKKLKDELAEAMNQVGQLNDASDRYDAIFKQKEILLNQAKFSRPEIVLASNKVSEISAKIKEIADVLEAGALLQVSLKQVIYHLKSASGWGTYDLLGGGLLATAAKRNKMNSAKKQMISAQHLLNQFNNEIEDISLSGVKLNIGGFSAFADYFLDGLIIDWIVQSSINKAYDVTMDVKEKVEAVINELALRDKELKEELTLAEEQYVKLIEIN